MSPMTLPFMIIYGTPEAYKTNGRATHQN